MAKISKLDPLLFEKVWGGQKLKQYKNDNALSNLGESWEVSTLSEGSSLIEGQKLSSLCELSYVVKFIDTTKDLSIQVHPNDEYARVHENKSGKTECWFILSAEKDCGIYLGLKDKVTKKEFKNALTNGVNIDQYLNFYKVKPGDFFVVPAGTIHAIGKGVSLCEVQQSSGITYRVWDWNRMGLDGKPRELHIKKALDCIEFSSIFFQNEVKSKFKNLSSINGMQRIYEHKDFSVDYFSYDKETNLEVEIPEKSSIVLFDGHVISNISLTQFDTGFCLDKGLYSLTFSSIARGLIVS